jgi:pimeloyl-ACP methyl ester carboxylesterase
VRPDPAADLSAYGVDRLGADVLDLAEAAGRAAPARFHIVGHDWGGQVAWLVAARHPDRVASLSVLSRPHPAAFRRAVEEDADDQRHRSRHHRAFHDPATVSLLLDNGAERLRRSLTDRGVPGPAVEEYLSVLGAPAALEAAVAWYRAVGALASVEVGPISVPTLYLWGDADHSVGASAARWTADFVTGGAIPVRDRARGGALHHGRGARHRHRARARAPRRAPLKRAARRPARDRALSGLEKCSAHHRVRALDIAEQAQAPGPVVAVH